MEENKEKDKNYALLIDSDNISAKYISSILAEMTKYGTITYKRIYGDWTSTHTTKWKKVILENSINPIQQFSNTVGKNSTDSALIIDAMDILFEDKVDGFCIVSSDSDFTRLASRLRESGMEVIGMGEEKTPKSFRNACNVFTSLEILLLDQSEDSSVQSGKEAIEIIDSEKNDNDGVIPKSTIENDIMTIITENNDKDKLTGLGEIGSRLVKKYSDFDVRNYGYSSLSKFLEETENFELVKVNSLVTIKLRDNKTRKQEIREFAVELVKNSTKKTMDLADLGRDMHAHFKDFKVKSYGYSNFAKFVQSIPELEIKAGRGTQRKVNIRNK